ncbi:MAG: sulfurtransferase TusA family protein [Pseudomonadota bacterium]
MEFDQLVDASGLSCPLPLLRAKKAIAAMAAGSVIKILATDPGSIHDFEAFSNATGHVLLSSGQEDGRFVFLLRKV